MQLVHWLNRHDPGLNRVRDATKSICAMAVVALISVFWLGLVPTVMGGTSALFICLSHEGVTKRQQLMSMLYAALGFLLCVSLGVLLRPMPSLAQGILILLCFVAFYLRRYGPRFAIAPVFAAITYLLVIMLPPIGPIALPQMMTAVLLATVVAIGLHFVAWRPSEIRTFHQRLWSLVSRYQELTLALKQCCDQAQLDADQCLAFKPLINETEAHFRNLYAHLGRYACNQEHQEALHDWLQCQYATFKTLQMARESILQLARQRAPYAPERRRALVVVLQRWYDALSSLSLQRRAILQDLALDSTQLQAATQAFTQVIFSPQAHITEYFVYWSNIAYACQRVIEKLHDIVTQSNRCRSIRQRAAS